MAKVLNAKLLKPDEVVIEKIVKYDLIGFGSGIYFSKFHRTLLELIENLPNFKNKKAFIFYTSGAEPSARFTKLPKDKLIERGFNIIGEFSCKAFDTFGLLKLFGGINRGRPNENDLREAENFARNIKNKM